MTTTELLVTLADKGIKHVICQYSGSGDSGQIDDVWYLRHTDNEDDMQSRTDIGLTEDFETALEKKFYRLLEDIEDWYNNDGGYGKIHLNIPNGDYTIENHVYEMIEERFDHEGIIDAD